MRAFRRFKVSKHKIYNITTKLNILRDGKTLHNSPDLDVFREVLHRNSEFELV